ncbi:MAG: TatD family hydrolase [Clostridiales bacterium]|nr:TatD family hydrolase [Clostridiales bacterium]
MSDKAISLPDEILPGAVHMFDTHAHYDDEKLAPVIHTLLPEIFASGVDYILNAGTNPDTSRHSLELAERYPGIYAACGMHPGDSGRYGSPDDYLPLLEEQLKHPKCVALGEIGLDYHYDFTDRETQRIWLYAQLELAEKTGKPVIMHNRDAHGDCMEAARRYPNVTGVFHSFSGSRETAAELVEMGWYISFSGVVTFKNAGRVREVARSIPDDRILIETDCPYMTPVPFRGRTNHSGYMQYTAAELASLRGMELDEFCALTCENGKRLYRIN